MDKSEDKSNFGEQVDNVSVIARVESKPERHIDVDIPPDMADQFEDSYVSCNDPDKILSITGSADQRERYLKFARIWAASRSERLTVRLYPHPDPKPETTYFRIIPFVRSTN